MINRHRARDKIKIWTIFYILSFFLIGCGSEGPIEPQDSVPVVTPGTLSAVDFPTADGCRWEYVSVDDGYTYTAKVAGTRNIGGVAGRILEIDSDVPVDYVGSAYGFSVRRSIFTKDLNSYTEHAFELWLDFSAMFSIDPGLETDLDSSRLTSKLQQAFRDNGVLLGESGVVSIQKSGGRWLIRDNLKTYLVKKEGDELNVYDFDNTYFQRYLPKRVLWSFPLYASKEWIVSKLYTSEIIYIRKVISTDGTLTVPAGDFKNVYYVEEYISTDVQGERSLLAKYWLVPNIGIIKYEYMDPTYGVVKTYELRRFEKAS